MGKAGDAHEQAASNDDGSEGARRVRFVFGSCLTWTTVEGEATVGGWAYLPMFWPMFWMSPS